MPNLTDDSLFKYLMGNSNPAPQDAYQAPTATPTPAPSPLQSQQDIVVTDNGFHPSKIPLLTRIGDMIIGHGAFEGRIRRNDAMRALEGYNDDPHAALQRLMKVPGYTSTALALMDRQADNDETGARTQIMQEQLKEKRLGNVRAMLGAANEKNYSKVKQYAEQYWAAKDYDPSELGLPDSYDPDMISAFRNGGMTVDQQEDNNRTESYNKSRLELSKFRAENTKRYQEARLGLSKQGQEEKVRHDRAMEDKLPAPTKANPSPGREGQIVYDPTGNYAKKYIGGKWFYFQKSSKDGKHYLIKGQGFDGPDEEDDSDEDD